MKVLLTRQLCTGHVVDALREELGIGPVLRKIRKRSGCRVSYERALLAMTANRIVEPESKLGVRDRWLAKVHLPTGGG